MTAAENRAVAARGTPDFRFYLNGTEFHAAAGARLQFRSKADDTLSLPSMPAGMFAGGDAVHVTYKGTKVFQGTVEKIIDRPGRGLERVNDVTVAGPWAKMNRLVFRQQWQSRNAAGAGVTFLCSRVVLNRSPLGLDYTVKQQIDEILAYAAPKCGFAAGTVDADALVLPADETRDLTCASALMRELRFHPKKIVSFDYSGATPTLSVTTPATADASYVAAIPKTAREYERNVHPVTAVDVQTNDVTIVGTGDAAAPVSSIGHQVYPANADVTGLDVLHCYVPLAPGGGSNNYKSCELECEAIPTGGISMKQFWKNYHPRLANVALDAITIAEATRTGTHENPYLVRNAASELKEAGISFEREMFKCKCTITTPDDIEEEVYLSMEFLTTSSLPKTYTWQTGSTSMAGETLPEGLARAIYEQRTQSAYLNETMTIRLGDALPRLGDACDGLYLQEYSVDIYDLTAELHFGQPDYLTAEDMRDLLNGFRGRAYTSVETIRAEPDVEEAAEEVGRIPPLSSTEFSPGTKKKTTIKSATSGGGGAIVLDSSALASADRAAINEVTVADADGSERKVKMLATEPIDLSAVKSANGAKGAVNILGGKGIEVTTEGGNIKIAYVEGKEAEDQPPETETNPNTSCANHPGGDGVEITDDGGGSGGLGGGVTLGGGNYGSNGAFTGGGASCNCD